MRGDGVYGCGDADGDMCGDMGVGVMRLCGGGAEIMVVIMCDGWYGLCDYV